MNIFESLENLPVSESCFEDIIKIVEEYINELGGGPLWGATLSDKYLNKKLGGKRPLPWEEGSQKIEDINNIQFAHLSPEEKNRFIKGFGKAAVQSLEDSGWGKTRSDSDDVDYKIFKNPDYQKMKNTATKALKGKSKSGIQRLRSRKYNPDKLYKLGKTVISKKEGKN